MGNIPFLALKFDTMKKQTSDFSKKNRFLLISGIIWALGLLSILVHPFGYETTLTTWVDNWGTKTGWIIRISMFSGGLIGFMIAMKEYIYNLPKDESSITN